MGRELIAKEIDGSTYEFTQFNTTNSLLVLGQLTKLLGEPMTIALGAFFRNKESEKAGELENGVPASKKESAKSKGSEKKPDFFDREIDEKMTDILAKAVRALIERMDEHEVVRLIKKLTSEGVLCDNLQVVFDEHYRGKSFHLFKVLSTALEVQYGNFIDAISAQVPALSRTPTRTATSIKSV